MSLTLTIEVPVSFPPPGRGSHQQRRSQRAEAPSGGAAWTKPAIVWCYTAPRKANWPRSVLTKRALCPCVCSSRRMTE